MAEGYTVIMLLEKIIKEVDLSRQRKLESRELRSLGYIISTRKLTLGKPGEDTGIFIAEVLDEDTKKPTSFCYLYSVHKRTGIILAKKYDYYINLDAT